MKYTVIDPPRVFRVGAERRISIRDCARIHLEADEQITLVTGAGAEYDITRKEWGYYATPSLNGRLRAAGLRGALVKNTAAKLYVLLMETGKETEFAAYLASEKMDVVAWLDDDYALTLPERPAKG